MPLYKTELGTTTATSCNASLEVIENSLPEHKILGREPEEQISGKKILLLGIGNYKIKLLTPFDK